MVIKNHHYVKLIIFKFKTLTNNNVNEKLKKWSKRDIWKTLKTKIECLKFNVLKQNKCEI